MDWQKGFLCSLESEIPWESLELLVESIDPGSGRIFIEAYERRRVMLRVFVLRHWLGLTPLEAERILKRRMQLRDFAGIGTDQPVPSPALIQEFEALLSQGGIKDVVRAAVPRALGSVR